MARTKWTIRNYNAAISELRKSNGLSLNAARSTYRGVKERLGRSVYGVDVKKHSRISKQEVKRAKVNEWIEEWESTAEYGTGK